jgi:hypothetical protein
MTPRDVVDRRIATLTGLLHMPGGALGRAGGGLAARLQGEWAAERRLLERLLADTTGDDVMTTIQHWRDRTASFAARSGDVSPSWTDRLGQAWDAQTVLSLLDDTEARIAQQLDAADTVD